MRQDGLPQVLRELATKGDQLPQVRFHRASLEEEDRRQEVIALNKMPTRVGDGHWWFFDLFVFLLLSLGIDPDLRDHPSVVDWRKAAVLGKPGKQNRIDVTRIELRV
jgi:hypothetical protein